MENHTVPAEILNPVPGELYRVLPDGRWAMFFDSHTLQGFSGCEQYGVYNTVERLRGKGPERPCISIGSWWSKVSEKFYTEAATTGKKVEGGSWSNPEHIITPQYLPISRMAAIAVEAWVEHNMDGMALTNQKKYESFAMPVDASMFASMLGLSGFDHVMMMAYQNKAKELYQLAGSAEQKAGRVEDHEEIRKMREEAARLDRLTTLPLGPILMACQYYQQYAENDFRNWRIIGAEKQFGAHNEVMIGEDDKVVVFYHGKPDLTIYEIPTDALMPLDQKTKEYITNDVETMWKPHNQLAGYIYATQKIARDLGFDRTVDRCLVSVCARNIRKTAPKKGEAEKPRFRRVRPTYSPQEIEEWRLNIMRKANRLRVMFEHNDVIRNDGTVCNGFFGHGCDYRGICSQPAGAREMIKKQDFVQVKPWSPLTEDDED